MNDKKLSPEQQAIIFLAQCIDALSGMSVDANETMVRNILDPSCIFSPIYRIMNGKIMLRGSKYTFRTEAEAHTAIAEICGDKIKSQQSNYRVVREDKE